MIYRFMFTNAVLGKGATAISHFDTQLGETTNSLFAVCFLIW